MHSIDASNNELSAASALKQMKKSARYRNSISTESPIVVLTPPNPEEVVREERRLSMDSIHSVQSSDEEKEKEEHLVPPVECEPAEIVAKLIKQRRASTITTLSNAIKQIFIEKKVKEDGVPALIIDSLYLGSIGAAKNLEWLKSHGITHILCVAGGIGACYPKQFIYKVIEINDAAHEDISIHFNACYHFIENAFNNNGKVLVHCFAGMSRSVTVTAAYLMQKQRIYAVPALKCVKKARNVANPNAGFILQLIKYQKVIGLNHQNQNQNKNKLKLNSPMLQEWEHGRRPSLFTALDKLRGIKNRKSQSPLDIDKVKLRQLKEVSDEADESIKANAMKSINVNALNVNRNSDDEPDDVVTPLETLDGTVTFPDTKSTTQQ